MKNRLLIHTAVMGITLAAFTTRGLTATGKPAGDLAAQGTAYSQAATKPLAWPVDKDDVAWDSPSQDAKGSMPIGNGDIGLNVWVEPNGNLLLLVAKSDSFDEFNRLLKLGRIRIRTTPALVQPGAPFGQVLRLSDGLIELKTAIGSVRVWVDANHPVAQVDMTSARPVAVEITLEDWRTARRALAGSDASISEAHSAWGNWPDKRLVNPDTIFPPKGEQLAWCHHNVESQWKRNLELTGLGAEVTKEQDPIIDRTFGALVRADGCAALSGTELKSENPVTHCSVRICALTEKAADPGKWLSAASALAGSIERLPAADRLAEHEKWWHAFWNRSWIDIEYNRRAATEILTYTGPLQVGREPNGACPFAGFIASTFSANRVLGDSEIARMAAGDPGVAITGTVGDISLASSFSVAAWIKPAPEESGRIFDRYTGGHGDGLLFDTYPGLSLRLSVGTNVIQCVNVLKPNEWRHVAATFDATTGAQKLYLDGKLLEGKTPETENVSRTYELQRFVTACAARGALPVKFNGSIFNVEGPDPDYRAWGGCYWWQNTRLIYWPLLYSGDYDMMLPLFAMYRAALPLREAATQAYYHHAGAFFPETMYFWGNYADGNYGFDRHGKPDGLVDSTFVRYYWQGGIELTAMMLDYYDATQDAAFRDGSLLPIARDILTFYDQHWPRGVDGKIVFEPAQSLETWQAAKNPLPEIAGLRYIIPRLMELPVDAATKAAWQKTLADLPPIPATHDKSGVRLLPAETFGEHRNRENAELYAVFPYRIYTCLANAEDKQIGLTTWRHRADVEDIGWDQDGIQAAMLGLPKEAAAMAAGRTASANVAAGYRFPVMWGCVDSTPGEDHGANLMTALQRMVMQCEGKRIVLLPAWPAGWNASFRLQAPFNTIVEGRVENGKLEQLQVTPESRHKDVEITEPSN